MKILISAEKLNLNKLYRAVSRKLTVTQPYANTIKSCASSFYFKFVEV